jgi:hypothetical protein
LTSGWRGSTTSTLISRQAVRRKTEAEADRHDLAAQAFLRLLKQLRVILLQDSVIMRREFPAHPLRTDPVFARVDYRTFAEDVELSLLAFEEPEEVRIRKTLPAIAERLNTLHQGLVRKVNEWGVKTKERLDSTNARLKDLFEGCVSMTLSSTRVAVQPAATTATGAATGAATAATIAPTPVWTMSFHFRADPAHAD